MRANYKKLLAGILMILAAAGLAGQQIEMGLITGVAGYAGEIESSAGYSTPDPEELSAPVSNITAGIYTRVHLSGEVSLRANFIYGSISASDATSADYARRLRNLHFRSYIAEASVQTEISILKKALINRAKSGGVPEEEISRLDNSINNYSQGRELRFYVFSGAGIFKFNPQASLDGVWHDLQPLGTEGQVQQAGGGEGMSDRRYSLTQVCIPSGAGFSYMNSAGVRVGIEFGYRTTFTDYIDDISTTYPDMGTLERTSGPVAARLSSRTYEVTSDKAELANFTGGQRRGNPAVNDAYFFSVMTVSYPLR